MGDPKSTLEKARKELEDMYLGIPDESVNLTFQDFVEVKKTIPIMKRNGSSSNTLDVKIARQGSSPLAIKSPSFNRDLPQGSYNIQGRDHHQHHHHHAPPSPILEHHTSVNGDIMHAGSHSHMSSHRHQHQHQPQHHVQHGDIAFGKSERHSPYGNVSHGKPNLHHNDIGHGSHHNMSMMEDHDVSGVSMVSGMYRERGGGRRRPGIPHSNICTICSTYIYVFRHRCLVCGRVYCRNCVAIGMGEMTEGRKCIDCIGRRFSQRYIGRAGQMGCCGTWSWRYSSMVKQAEVKWAEKGARRKGDHRGGGGSVMMSRSMAVTATTGHQHHHHHQNTTMPSSMSHSNPPSFVMTNTTSSAGHSPYTPTHHHLPF